MTDFTDEELLRRIRRSLMATAAEFRRKRRRDGRPPAGPGWAVVPKPTRPPKVLRERPRSSD